MEKNKKRKKNKCARKKEKRNKITQNYDYYQGD